LAEQYAGRLELTWTNKDKRLLAYEDGSYVWVSPSDYRVAEVRLLDEARLRHEHVHQPRHTGALAAPIRGAPAGAAAPAPGCDPGWVAPARGSTMPETSR
jgi:hypothetical protein